MSIEYDYDGYEKSLERSLTLAEKDYWTQYVDINRHQVNVAKTYLWVSVALLGSYAAAIGTYSQYILSSSCVVLFALLSTVSGIIAFGICLYAIPARKGYKAIPEISWGEFPLLANESLTNKEKNIYIKVLTDLNDKIDKANCHNVATNQKRASLLRNTSWVLLASFVFAVVTGVSSLLPLMINNIHQPTERLMTEDSDSQNQPQAQAQDADTTPDVPTPAGPISGGNPDMSTHSAQIPSSGTIRITESDNSGSEKE